MKKAVLLLSGGIDSATCGAIARSQGFDLFAMSFRYGQRHSIELESALEMGRFLGVKEHRFVEIDLRAFGGSSLTSDTPVPKGRMNDPDTVDLRRNGEEKGGEIPITYVPARNTIFLSFALGWAEIIQSSDIYIGVNAVDYSGYPDCRPEFIRAYSTMANLATRVGVEGGNLQIHTPLISLTKAEIIKKGHLLGLDYSITHSCYDPLKSGAACGECDSCSIRKNGFADAGIPDPTRYANQQ